MNHNNSVEICLAELMTSGSEEKIQLCQPHLLLGSGGSGMGWRNPCRKHDSHHSLQGEWWKGMDHDYVSAHSPIIRGAVQAEYCSWYFLFSACQR